MKWHVEFRYPEAVYSKFNIIPPSGESWSGRQVACSPEAGTSNFLVVREFNNIQGAAEYMDASRKQLEAFAEAAGCGFKIKIEHNGEFGVAAE